MIPVSLYALLPFALAGLASSVMQAPCVAQILPAAAAAAATIDSLVAMPPPLPPGGSYAPLGDRMRIQGRSIFAWLLDAPGTPPDIASWLTARQPALRDLWVSPEGIVLAGIEHGMHWVARLSDAGAGRTRGTVSVLPMDGDAARGDRHGARVPATGGDDAATAGHGRAARAAHPGWRLRGGQLHFEFRSRDEDASIAEQIWTHAVPPGPLRRQLFADLAADGWRPMEIDAPGIDASAANRSDAPPAAHAWSRGRVTLSMIIVTLDHGSGIMAVVRARA